VSKLIKYSIDSKIWNWIIVWAYFSQSAWFDHVIMFSWLLSFILHHRSLIGFCFVAVILKHLIFILLMWYLRQWNCHRNKYCKNLILGYGYFLCIVCYFGSEKGLHSSAKTYISSPFVTFLLFVRLLRFYHKREVHFCIY